MRRVLGFNMAKVLLSRFHKVFGRQFRLFISGGAKLDEKIETDLFRWGFTVLEGYGLTETSPITAFNPPHRPVIGSAGKAIPGVDIDIVDQDNQGIGEIVIRGPNVMKGYYKRDEETARVIKDGWFFSGDLGYIDPDGYLYIMGRSKELIVLSSGKNIYPNEIEKEFTDTPYIREMCVVGVGLREGAKTQDCLHAVVLPNFDFFKDRGEINTYDVLKNIFSDASKRLPPHKHITGLTVISQPLPRTTLGKIKRYEVEKSYQTEIIKDRSSFKKETVAEEEMQLLESETGKRVVQYLKEVFNIKKAITPMSSIEIDLGIDSLGRTELLSAMERAFGITLESGMVAGDIFTVKDLILKIEKALSLDSKARQRPGPVKPMSMGELVRLDLTEEFKSKIRLEPNFLDWILAFLIKGLLVQTFFKVFYRLRVIGSEKLPREGHYIMCVNHTSFFDGLIMGAAVPFSCVMKLFFIGFRTYFIVPVIRSLVKSGRILPIDAAQIVEAMQAAFFIIKNGKSLCIFPEGERSGDGKVKRFKKGVGIIAQQTKTRLLPAFIEGAFEAWPKTRRFPRPGRIIVRFGDAVSYDELLREGKAQDIEDDAEAIISAIRERVIALKDKG